MGQLYPDAHREQLLWMITSPTDCWRELRTLLNELQEYAQQTAAPFYAIFLPVVDMSTRSKFEQIEAIDEAIRSSESLLHLFVVIPETMRIAQTFFRAWQKMHPASTEYMSLVTNRQEALQAIQAQRPHSED